MEQTIAKASPVEPLQKMISQSQENLQNLARLLGALRLQYLEKERQILDNISTEKYKLNQYLEITKSTLPE